jgi:hypothetical protein
MCFACDMEAMWFAVMDARANAADGGESASQPPDEAAAALALGLQEETAATLPPPPERGRVGEGVAGGTDQAALIWGESEDPHPNPPPEEGGGSALSLGERSNPARERSASSRRFACEETSAE